MNRYVKELLLWLSFISSFFLFAILAISVIWVPYLWTFSVFGLAGSAYFATKLFEEKEPNEV